VTSLKPAPRQARGKGAGPEREVGTAPWMQGMLRGLLTTEALRTAMRHCGNQPLTGAPVQGGLEHLSLMPADLKALRAEGLMPPITLLCRDHEGGGGVKFQRWDGTQWTVLTDWIATDQALVRPLVEASARYAQEKGITPRNCPEPRGRSPELTPHRTRMRSPVVKRRTSPESGVFRCFPLHWSWRHWSLAPCAALIF
jgi:hypothetical protein